MLLKPSDQFHWIFIKIINTGIYFVKTIDYAIKSSGKVNQENIITSTIIRYFSSLPKIELDFTWFNVFSNYNTLRSVSASMKLRGYRSWDHMYPLPLLEAILIKINNDEWKETRKNSVTVYCWLNLLLALESVKCICIWRSLTLVTSSRTLKSHCCNA